MVRKTKEEAQETYTALLDAAEQVFREKGVTNTTLTDVAVAAGMTRGAIYWHFKDKIDLFKAMCDRAFLPVEAIMNEIAAGPGSNPLESLRQMSIHMLNLAATDTRQRAVFDILFHRCEKNSVLELYIQDREKRDECQDQIVQIFQEAVNKGQLPPDTDTWLAMHAHRSYLMGLISQWLEAPEDYDLALHAETMIDIFQAGLQAKPPLRKSPQ